MNLREAALAGDRGAAMVTRAELAAEWGVSRPAVTKLFKRPGAPAFEGGRIRLSVADAWRRTGRKVRRPSATPEVELADDMDIGEARRVQEVLKARTLSVEYRKLVGELVERSAVDARARADGAAVRSSLMALPASIAPSLADAAAAGGVPAVAALLEVEVRRLLGAWAGSVRGFAEPAAEGAP